MNVGDIFEKYKMLHAVETQASCQSLASAQTIAIAGLQSGQEIGRQESAAKIAELERDCMTLALRLYAEDYATFSPETMECMDRWRPRVYALLNQKGKSQEEE